MIQNQPKTEPFPPIPGGYTIESLVATSAFSKVYRARETLLGRWVAIKVFHLPPEDVEGLPYGCDEWRVRFIAEARLLAQMDHPHVIRVDALGFLDDGTPYMVMPWHVANLRKEIGRDSSNPDRIAEMNPLERPQALAPTRARDVVRQLCLGLSALHARGWVHRDVKPTNLLLTAREGGQVRLCDLGFAKRPGSGAKSRAGVWIGTPNYCAPEQREDACKATDRADIYSVGVLAYRLLTGHLPVGAFEPVAHAAFDRIIRKAMAPSPPDRPTAVEMAAQLRALSF